MKGTMLRYVIASCAALALLVGCGSEETKTVTAPAASTPPPTETAPAAKAARLGEPLTTDSGVVATAVSVKRGAEPNGDAAGADPLAAGEEWVLLTMRLDNRSSTDLLDDQSSFVLLDNSDTGIRPSCCNTFTGELGNEAITIGPGQKRQGVMAFKVPRSTKIAGVGWEVPGETPLGWQAP